MIEKKSCGVLSSSAVGLAICVLAAGACADAADPGAAYDVPVPLSERYGGTIVVAGSGRIQTFNPAATADELSAAMQREVVLMTLLRADDALRPLPYLAESWAINEDSTQVEFTLRSDVHWQDGRPTTAWDVEFTFQSLKDPATAFPNAQWFTGWDGPEVLDEHRIRFAVQPHSGLLGGWTRLPILPRHILSGTNPVELARHEFGRDPVGNGPFHLVERPDGDTWVFEANEIFPEGLGGRPFADRLVYRAIPDPSTQLAELRAGDVVLLHRPPPLQVRQAREIPQLVVEEYPSRAYGFIAWNGRRPAFQSAAVRRALTMAINREDIVATVLEGLGEVANGPVGDWSPSYDPELRPLSFDPASARAILEAEGWKDSDADGVRDRDGLPFSFTLLANERTSFQRVAEIVQAQLGAIGVDVEIEYRDNSSFIDTILSPEREFDAFVLEWEPDLEIDDRQLFSCATVGEALQFSSYCNRDLEATLDSIPMARSREDASRLIRRYARVVARDQPHTFLYFVRDATIFRRELKGVEAGILGDLTHVRTWWIHPAVRTEPPAESAASDDSSESI